MRNIENGEGLYSKNIQWKLLRVELSCVAPKKKKTMNNNKETVQCHL